MDQRLAAYLKGAKPEKYRTAGIIVAVLLVGVIVAVMLTQPKRSVAAYCKVYNQEKIQLGNESGSNYEFSTTVFPNAASNDPGYFIPAFSKLSAVAPKEIEPQVVAMKDVWEKMKSDPTATVSLALNGLPAESAVTQWTQQHCVD